jgi:hypothetical protein
MLTSGLEIALADVDSDLSPQASPEERLARLDHQLLPPELATRHRDLMQEMASVLDDKASVLDDTTVTVTITSLLTHALDIIDAISQIQDAAPDIAWDRARQHAEILESYAVALASVEEAYRAGIATSPRRTARSPRITRQR